MMIAPNTLVHWTLVLLLTLSGPVLAQTPASSTPPARVISVSGTAVVDGTSITRGTALQVGQIIETGPASRVRMRFVGGSLLTLGENTTFELTEYEPATNNEPQQAYFRVLEGVILAVAEGITPGTDSFVIETQAATMGIRGTIVWGGYFIPGQADYVLLEGGPVVIANEFGTIELREPGQGTTVLVDPAGVGETAPYDPTFWSAEKAFDAITTIAIPSN